MPTNTPRSIAEALIAKWRARATDVELNVQARAATDTCADELGAALATANGAEVAALPEPVAVAHYTDDGRLTFLGRHTPWPAGDHDLYTAAQLRAYAERCSRGEDGRDAARLDWLCMHVVNVRDAAPHGGSTSLFWSSPEDLDGDEGPSDLRERIDAAIAGEGGDHA